MAAGAGSAAHRVTTHKPHDGSGRRRRSRRRRSSPGWSSSVTRARSAPRSTSRPRSSRCHDGRRSERGPRTPVGPRRDRGARARLSRPTSAGRRSYEKGRAWVDSQDEATSQGRDDRLGAPLPRRRGRALRASDRRVRAAHVHPCDHRRLDVHRERSLVALRPRDRTACNLTGSTARLFSDVLSNVGTKQLGATLLALANLVFFGFGFGRSLQLAHARSWGVEVKKDLLGDLGLYFVALLTMVAFLTGVSARRGVGCRVRRAGRRGR